MDGEEQCKRRRTTGPIYCFPTPVNIHISQPDIPVPGVRYRSQDGYIALSTDKSSESSG